MMKKKVLLVGTVIFCLAACVTAQETQNEGEKKMDIVALDKFIEAVKAGDVSFVVAYNKKFAEPVLVAPGPDNLKIEVFENQPVEMERIQNPLFKEKYVEIKATTIFSAYGSPGCQLVRTPTGNYIWVQWAQ